MKKILNNLHYFIIFYAVFQMYTDYQDHQMNLELEKDSLPQLRKQLSKLRREKKELKAYYQDVEKAKERIEFVAQEVEKVQKKLPEEILDTEILGFLKRIAQNLKMKNVFLNPADEVNKGFYFAKRYELKALGTFQQFLVLLERIGESERILNIKSIDFNRSDESRRSRFQLITGAISIEAYKFNKSHKEDRGIEDITAKVKPNAKKKLKKKKRNKK